MDPNLALWGFGIPKSLWESRDAHQETLIMRCLFHKIVVKNYGERDSTELWGVPPSENLGFPGKNPSAAHRFFGGWSSTAWIPLESPSKRFPGMAAWERFLWIHQWRFGVGSLRNESSPNSCGSFQGWEFYPEPPAELSGFAGPSLRVLPWNVWGCCAPAVTSELLPCEQLQGLVWTRSDRSQTSSHQPGFPWISPSRGWNVGVGFGERSGVECVCISEGWTGPQ